MTDDVETARHLASALHAHRVRVERDGGAVPATLHMLERLARSRVNPGQAGSTFDQPGTAPHDESVTARLLTYRAAADALAVSESTVKRLVAAGALPVVHVGGAARIRVEDLDAFVGGMTEPALAPA